MIFLFRAFISDIHRQLQQHQAKRPIRVYRRQMISSVELKNLKQCIGQFISVNSFFSTSTDYETALSFLGMSDASCDLEGVLFEIDADPQMVTTKPFADVSAYSDFPDESEVLFMLGSIFRLNSINRGDNQVWIIRMTLCSDDENDLKQVLMYMKQQIGSGETNLRILGKVLWEMGKLDLAGKYFSRLLEQLPSSDPLLSSLYEDLGKLASQTGDYDMSMQWHQKSLAIKNKNQLTDNSISKYIEREPIFFKRASYMTSNILSSKIILVKLGREESLRGIVDSSQEIQFFAYKSSYQMPEILLNMYLYFFFPHNSY